MSGNDVLNQDEIDALLHGVDSGAVKTDAGPVAGEIRNYDFANQVRIVRGRMPTLEMINERFARLFRTSLFNMLRRTPEVAVEPVKMQKFSEYVHSLHVPTNLNLVKILPLRGTGLIVLDPYSKVPLPENGADVEFTTYWRRRLRDGDVVLQSESASADATREGV